MNQRYSTEQLRQAEQDHTVFYTALILVLTAVFCLLFGLYALVASLSLDVFRWCLGGIVAFGAFSVGVNVFLGWHSWRQHVKDREDLHVAAENQRRTIEKAKHDLEMAAARAALTAPALPLLETNRVIPVTAGERVGEVALETICGYDFRFVEWLADYLTGKGNVWTEARLCNMPLPFVGGVFGKAEVGTAYTFWFGVPDGKLLVSGVIINRGGAGNKSGALAIVTAPAIVDALRGVK